MYKSLVVLFTWCAVSSAMPHWQILPPVPGYIPVYIQHGDTPLEEINLDLAEAFHAIPSGRSASSNVLAAPDDKEEKENNIVEEMQGDAPQPPEPPKKFDELILVAPSKEINNSPELPADVQESRAEEKKSTDKETYLVD